MLKKVLSLMLAVILVSGLCVFAETETKTVVTKVLVSDEAMIDEADPDTVKEPVAMNGYAYLKGGTDNEDAENTDPDIRVVLQKFDISRYTYPVEVAKLRYVYRDKAPEDTGYGDGNVMIFKVPAEWDSETVTWNTFNETPFDFTKDSLNYVANGKGDGANNSDSSCTIDITELLNAALQAEEEVIAFAYARDVKKGNDGLTANRKNELRIITGRATISVEATYEKPVYKTDGTVESILYSDRTLIAPNCLDTVPAFSSGYGFYYGKSSPAIGIYNASNDTEPYGVSRTNYIKFDLSDVDLTKPIKKIEVSYGLTSNKGYWSVYHYIVDNDNWKGAHGTGTQESELLWGDAFETNAETGEVTAKTYAPNKDKYAFAGISAEDLTGGILKTAGDNAAEVMNSFDITELIKNEIEDDGFDGKISLAVMVKDCLNASGKEPTTRGNVRIVFNSGTSGVMDYAKNNKEFIGPVLNITYDNEGNTDFSEVQFKAGDSETLEEGSFVLSAKTEVTSTLEKGTNATLLMCVYEGDFLKGIYKTTGTVNGKDTNGGVSEISVSSGEEVEITEDTKVKVMLWNGFMFQNPITVSKEITPVTAQ